MRYIKVQPHPASCVPIAILNAMKWLGDSVGYRDHVEFMYNAIYKDVKVGQHGFCNHNTSKLLNMYKLNYKRHYCKSIKDLDNILKRGNAMMFSDRDIIDGNVTGHMCFIYDDALKGKYFRTVNYYKNPLCNLIRRKDMVKIMKRTKKIRPKGCTVYEIMR